MTWRRFATAILLALATSAPADGQLSAAKVALSGETAPNSGGLTFTDFGWPSLDAGGRIAFFASLNGSTGIYSTASGMLDKVARIGDMAPNSGGFAFTGFVEPVIGGGVSFYASFGGSSGGGRGIFSTASGALDRVALSGETAPGSGGQFFTDFGPAVAIDRGSHVAFAAGLSGGAEGIYNTASGALGKVAITGETAPNSGGLAFTGFMEPAIGGGRVAFAARLTGDVWGVYSTASGALDKVAKVGDTAPNSGGLTITGLLDPGIDGGGRVVFFATLSGNNTGVFSTASGTLHKVALSGETAPASGGLTFTGVSGGSIAGGKVAIAGVLSDGSRGIYSTTSGTLGVVARSGTTAPGTGGATFAPDFGGPAINASGHLAFLGALTLGGPVTVANDTGLWAQGPDGSLFLVVREGDLFDSDGLGTMRTVSGIRFLAGGGFGGADTQAIGWNDFHQITFELNFTDGNHGVYVAPVPEPSAILAVGLATLGAATVWRWRRLTDAVRASR